MQQPTRHPTNYFFCPEVVTEVAASWNVPTVPHGYRFG
jgi:hypothetical protein